MRASSPPSAMASRQWTSTSSCAPRDSARHASARCASALGSTSEQVLERVLRLGVPTDMEESLRAESQPPRVRGFRVQERLQRFQRLRPMLLGRMRFGQRKVPAGELLEEGLRLLKRPDRFPMRTAKAVDAPHPQIAFRRVRLTSDGFTKRCLGVLAQPEREQTIPLQGQRETQIGLVLQHARADQLGPFPNRT